MYTQSHNQWVFSSNRSYFIKKLPLYGLVTNTLIDFTLVFLSHSIPSTVNFQLSAILWELNLIDFPIDPIPTVDYFVSIGMEILSYDCFSDKYW